MTQTFSLSATDLLLIFRGLSKVKNDEEINEIDRKGAEELRTRLMIEIAEREKGHYGMVDGKHYEEMKTAYKEGGKFKEFVDKASQMYGDTPDDEMHKMTVFEYFKSVQKGGCNER